MKMMALCSCGAYSEWDTERFPEWKCLSCHRDLTNADAEGLLTGEAAKQASRNRMQILMKKQGGANGKSTP